MTLEEAQVIAQAYGTPAGQKLLERYLGKLDLAVKAVITAPEEALASARGGLRVWNSIVDEYRTAREVLAAAQKT